MPMQAPNACLHSYLRHATAETRDLVRWPSMPWLPAWLCRPAMHAPTLTCCIRLPRP